MEPKSENKLLEEIPKSSQISIETYSCDLCKHNLASVCK